MSDTTTPHADFTPLPADARMDGYYIGFDRTGCDPVDAILSAIAIAGKGSHNTDGWNDESTYYANWPGLPDVGAEATANDLIQKTAERAAREIAAHDRAVSAKAFDEAVAMCCTMAGLRNINWPNPYRDAAEATS